MSIGQEKLIQHIVCDRAAAIKSCRAKSIVCPEHPFNVIDFSGMVMRSWRQVAKPEARPNLVYDGRSASEILDRVCRFRNWSFVVGLVSPIVRHPHQRFGGGDEQIRALDIEQSLFGNVGAALGVPSSLFGVVSSGHSSGERESTHDSANGGPVRRLLGSVGSVPLGTQIGTAIIVTCLAWVSVTWGFICLLDWRTACRNRVAYGLLMLFGMLGLSALALVWR
ncbi:MULTISPECIES: hypothetical protein [unclassified Mesorhizobium]|uniref:hypothetical protein n=1 Tax=unclassified Mesorhizobium TaxID=325217 RepID=UPI003337A585